MASAAENFQRQIEASALHASGTSAFRTGVATLGTARRDAERGSQATAVRALSFAKTLQNKMTAPEQSVFGSLLAATTAEVYQPKTTAQSAAARAALAAQDKTQTGVIDRENKILGGSDPGGQWWNPASWAYDYQTQDSGTYTYGGTGSGGAQVKVSGNPTGFFPTLARNVAGALPGTGVRNPDGSAPLGTKLVWLGVGALGVYLFVKVLGYMTAGRQVQAARYSTAQAALSNNPRRRRRRTSRR